MFSGVFCCTAALRYVFSHVCFVAPQPYGTCSLTLLRVTSSTGRYTPVSGPCSVSRSLASSCPSSPACWSTSYSGESISCFVSVPQVSQSSACWSTSYSGASISCFISVTQVLQYPLYQLLRCANLLLYITYAGESISCFILVNHVSKSPALYQLLRCVNLLLYISYSGESISCFISVTQVRQSPALYQLLR